jgi:cation-transporting ATPase 13A1
MSDEIYPGDVILLQRNKHLKKQSVPCDLLMLSGSVVVNEAILTGESCPLVKEGIANLDQNQDHIDLNGEHKNHVLHSGTDILQFTPADDIQLDVPQLAKIPNINDGGIICVALKNGFETKQGKLMRVILFGQDRVSVESPEVYLYLLILLVFALAASYHVLTECLKDQDRSRYKIILRCILIITNVVPPELPMQLSMAVNYSIIQLIQK